MIRVPGIGYNRRIGFRGIRASALMSSAATAWGFALPAELSSTLQPPAEPVLTSFHSPSTLAGLNTALATPGADVTVDFLEETSGTIVIGANDIYLHGNLSLIAFRLEFAVNVHRIRIEGMNFLEIAFRLPAFFDDELGQQIFDEALAITDVNFDLCSSGFNDGGPTPAPGNGITVYGKRIFINGGNYRGTDYGMFVGNAGGIFNEDIVASDAYFEGRAEATMRVHQTLRHVCHGCTLGSPAFSIKHGWRIHDETDLAYCANNTLNPGGIMLSDPAEPSDVGLGQFWVQDNTITYGLANGVIITTDPYTRFTQGTISGNTFVNSGAASFEELWSWGVVPVDWDLSGNIIQ